MIKQSSTAALLWAAPLLLFASPPLAAQVEREHVERLCEELRERGFEIDFDSLKVETARPGNFLADLDRQQDLFFAGEHFECMPTFLDALGYRLPLESGAFRAAVVQGYGSKLRAYYQFDRDAMVFVEGDGVDAVLGNEAIIVHELAHAWRDQRFGIEHLMDDRPRTLEDARIAQCLLEGEAEIVSLDVMLMRGGTSLDDLDPDTIESPLEGLLAGPALALIYQRGRAFALRRYQAGGWAAVREAFVKRPPSSEQILHEAKFGHDRPVSVTLPPWPTDLGEAQLCREDVIGELGSLMLLLEGGLPQGDAHLGTIGWDGDRLATYTLPDGERACWWRTLWDREEDAKQFARALRKLGSGTSRTRGRIVDWASAPSREVVRGLLRVLGKHPHEGLEDPGDALSTQRIEEEYQRQNDLSPRFEDGVWVHPRFGLRVPAPEGWKPGERNGVQFLLTPMRKGFADNVSVVDIPAVAQDLGRIRDEMEAGLAKMEGLELVSLVTSELAGRSVLRARYRGTAFGPNVTFDAVVFLHAGRRVEVTVSVLTERSEERAVDVRAILDGLTFE